MDSDDSTTSTGWQASRPLQGIRQDKQHTGSLLVYTRETAKGLVRLCCGRHGNGPVRAEPPTPRHRNRTTREPRKTPHAEKHTYCATVRPHDGGGAHNGSHPAGHLHGGRYACQRRPRHAVGARTVDDHGCWGDLRTSKHGKRHRDNKGRRVGKRIALGRSGGERRRVGHVGAGGPTNARTKAKGPRVYSSIEL